MDRRPSRINVNQQCVRQRRYNIWKGGVNGGVIERERGMKRGGCVQRRGSNRDFVCVKSIHPICSSCNSEGAAELEKSSTAVAEAKHCIAKLPSNNTSLSGKRLFSRLLFFFVFVPRDISSSLGVSIYTHLLAYWTVQTTKRGVRGL